MSESIAFVRGSRANGLIPRFVHLAIAASALGLTGVPALAQDEGGAAASTGVQEVTVTGTRIRQQTGMNTPVPVTTLNVGDLASLKPGASIGDQLDKLPQLVQTESAQRG